MKTPLTVPEWKPGMPSVWVQVGFGDNRRAGRRVVDQPVVVGAVARMMMVEYGVDKVYVHTDRCSAGRTDPRPCTCSPTVVRRG